MFDSFFESKQDLQILYLAEAFYTKLRLSPKQILDHWGKIVRDYDGKIPPCPTYVELLEIIQLLCLDGDILPDANCFSGDKPELFTYHSCRLEQEIAKMRGGNVPQTQQHPAIYG